MGMPGNSLNGVEWQYFTMFCDDGMKLSGALTRGAKNCDIWLSAYGEKNLSMQRHYSLNNFASKKQGHFKMGDSEFIRDAGRTSIHIKENDLELILGARSLVDWKNNTMEYVIKDKKVEWEVPLLRADCEGSLSLGGEKKMLKGILFHDVVKHNLSPDESPLHFLRNFKSWMWGIMYSDRYSILFVDVNYIPKPFRFLCIGGPEGVMSCNDAIRQSDFNFISCKGSAHSLLDIASEYGMIKVHSLKKYDVAHGGKVSKLVSKVLGMKRHYVGRFSFNKEEGEAYLESFKLF